MDWKVQLRNPKIQQGIMEVAFPIAGYLFWDWSLLIIVVFYLMDWLASQVMYTRRLNKVKNQFNEKMNWVVPLSISVSVLVVVGMSSFLYLFFEREYGLVLDKNLNQELVTFFKAELWYLFPIILFSYHLMDKMLFYAPRRFTNYSVRPYLYRNIVSNSSASVLIFLGVVVYANVTLSEIVTILSIVIIKLMFDVLIKKKVLKID
jgi:hypothetical protein